MADSLPPYGRYLLPAWLRLNASWPRTGCPELPLRLKANGSHRSERLGPLRSTRESNPHFNHGKVARYHYISAP